jgi:uncharacterized membrane protein
MDDPCFPPPALLVMMFSALVSARPLFGTHLALVILRAVRAYRGEWPAYPLVAEVARRIVGV